MPMPGDPSEGSGRQWVGHWYRRGHVTRRGYAIPPNAPRYDGTVHGGLYALARPMCPIPMILSTYKCGQGVRPGANSHTYKLAIIWQVYTKYGRYQPKRGR